jgi:hypothetical protein
MNKRKPEKLDVRSSKQSETSKLERRKEFERLKAKLT